MLIGEFIQPRARLIDAVRDFLKPPLRARALIIRFRKFRARRREQAALLFQIRRVLLQRRCAVRHFGFALLQKRFGIRKDAIGVLALRDHAFALLAHGGQPAPALRDRYAPVGNCIAQRFVFAARCINLLLKFAHLRLPGFIGGLIVLLLIVESGQRIRHVRQLSAQAIALRRRLMHAFIVGALFVQRGLQRFLRAGAEHVLLVQRFEQFAALPLQRRALLIHLLVHLAQLLQLIADFGKLLFRFFDFAGTGKQAGHARLHAAAGHRSAGMHYVALDRHQSKLIAGCALNGDAAAQILGDHGSAQQIIDHALIFGVEFHQLRSHAHAPRHGQYAAFLRGERAPANRSDGQKRGAAVAIRAQIFDHALRILIAIHHDVLQRSAQHHVHGALQALRHAQQIRHDAVYARSAAAPRLQKHLLDRIVVALVIALHFAKQLQSRIGGLPLRLQIAYLFRQRLQAIIQPLYAQIVLLRFILKLFPALLFLRNSFLCLRDLRA